MTFIKDIPSKKKILFISKEGRISIKHDGIETDITVDRKIGLLLYIVVAKGQLYDDSIEDKLLELEASSDKNQPTL